MSEAQNKALVLVQKLKTKGLVLSPYLQPEELKGRPELFFVLWLTVASEAEDFLDGLQNSEEDCFLLWRGLMEGFALLRSACCRRRVMLGLSYVLLEGVQECSSPKHKCWYLRLLCSFLLHTWNYARKKAYIVDRKQIFTPWFQKGFTDVRQVRIWPL